MTGGLIVLGSLFLSFVFRSAIVGDLASAALARPPTQRAMLPGTTTAPSALVRDFEAARERGRAAPARLDDALDHVRTQGVDARIVGSSAERKHVRVYGCASCARGENELGCDHERGLLAGAFEAIGAELARVHETVCQRDGDAYCEFEVKHAPHPAVR